jgi:hypothetical protein
MKQNILILNLLLSLSIGTSAFGESLQDITVNVPTAPSLKVVGTPGTNQPTNFSIAACKRDDHGNLEKFGCEDSNLYDLNQIILLKPGYYKIYYDISREFIEVAKDPIVIELQKINISKTDGTYICSVFPDLSDASTKMAFLRDYWSMPIWLQMKDYCEPTNMPNMSSERQKVCDALFKNAKTPQDFDGSVMKFISPKEFMAFPLMYSDEQWEKHSPAREIHDGDFVSVLPGVYGIEFKSPRDDSTMQTGIVVK